MRDRDSSDDRYAPLVDRMRGWLKDGRPVYMAESTPELDAAADELVALGGHVRSMRFGIPCIVKWTPTFSTWRHGGWYVNNCVYPSGAVGCVSRNYPDRKWRIVCDKREGDFTYPTRVAAAQAEYAIATGLTQ